MPPADIEILTDPAAVAHAAADHFLSAVRAAAAQSRRYAVALSGGSTPKALYGLLAADSYRTRIPWDVVHVFWADERCVPPDSPDSNFRLAHDALLAHVPIPAGNIHRVRTEAGDCATAAAEYARELATWFNLASGVLPAFDLIWLGLGEDGHTASLFPGAPALEERAAPAVATPPGRLPPSVDRVTLTLPVLNAAHEVVFLVTGAAKAPVVRRVLAAPGAPGEPLLPAARVRPAGRLRWILDQAAARELESA